MSTEIVDIHRVIRELIGRMSEEVEIEIDEEITSETTLIGDLGFASVDFVQLIVAIEEHYGRKMGFHDLIMPDGQYVPELSIDEIARFVQQKMLPGVAGEEASLTDQAFATSSADDFSAIDEATVDAFRRIMPSPPISIDELSGATRNPRAAFILSAPRTGSTLLRVILAGHPELFSPPELHLLYYPTLMHRRAALDNEYNRHLLSGTTAAIMKSKGCSAEVAESLMSEYEGKTMPTIEFYRSLQESLGGKLLIDKTPLYAFYTEVLERAERIFNDALFVHLVRHPGGMIQSYDDAKLEKLVPFLRESTFSRREIAELIWIVTQQNIIRFLSNIPVSRQHRVHYEDLVNNPEETVSALCRLLGVELHPDMLDPYMEKDDRMTDGVHTTSEFSGDLKFHLHQRIEPTAATRWIKYLRPETLSELTQNMARELDYDPRSA